MRVRKRGIFQPRDVVKPRESLTCNNSVEAKKNPHGYSHLHDIGMGGAQYPRTRPEPGKTLAKLLKS